MESDKYPLFLSTHGPCLSPSPSAESLPVPAQRETNHCISLGIGRNTVCSSTVTVYCILFGALGLITSN